MTKTELRKQTTKKVLNHLIEEFNIYNINRENQYFDFWADYKSHRFQLQMDTRGYDISSWDSVKLSGDGWSQEQIDKQRFAEEIEDIMNERVRELVGYSQIKGNEVTKKEFDEDHALDMVLNDMVKDIEVNDVVKLK